MEKPKGFNEITDKDKQKNYIRGKLREYVESITERDPEKRQYYKCVLPECNREHKNSTGGAFSIAANQIRWRCFSCQKGGDIFDLIGYQYGYKLPEIEDRKPTKKEKAEEYQKEFLKACELFNLAPDFIPAEEHKQLSGSSEVPPREEAAPDPEGTANFKEYLEQCKKNCTPDSKGFSYFTGRGFTAETIDKFNLGYDSNENAVSIPYSKSYNYYILRYIEPIDNKHKKPAAEQAGAEPIFNSRAIYKNQYCFVCEAPLDAISIMQAGGTAIALGGTDYNKLLKLIETEQPNHCLILNFDNDDPGQTKQKELAKKLRASGISFIEAVYNFDKYGEPKKDSNDLLVSNPDQLREDVLYNIDRAKNNELESGTGLFSINEYQHLFKEHQTTEKQRISTGFKILDQALYGGLTNELYILSAETSIGKSAICACIAQNIAASGINVLYYALEMGRFEFIARGSSMISREENKDPIPYAEILNYKWDERTEEFYRRSYSSYEKYVDEYMQRYGEHLYIIEGGFNGKTALEIAEVAEKVKKENNLSQLVIIVDYLQRLKADPGDRAQRDAMSITSAAVQVLGNLASQKHNTVIAISSISNAQNGQRVSTAAGKYSGDIAYTGGVLLGWNWHGYTDTTDEDEKEETARLCKERGYREMILEVLKQRSGERDKKLTMFYYPPYNYFTAPSINGKVRPHK